MKQHFHQKEKNTILAHLQQTNVQEVNGLCSLQQGYGL